MTEGKTQCRVEKCKRPYRAKGYCNAHYKKWRRGELTKGRYKTCAQEACRKKRFQRGLCEEHYKTAFGKKEEGAAVAASLPGTAPVAESASAT
ncbi:MAG: vegetative protein [Deltaproteobacteria bacterium]|nr:vegetative protein [Deltaproteobacteria bacterium]